MYVMNANSSWQYSSHSNYFYTFSCLAKLISYSDSLMIMMAVWVIIFTNDSTNCILQWPVWDEECEIDFSGCPKHFLINMCTSKSLGRAYHHLITCRKRILRGPYFQT